MAAAKAAIYSIRRSVSVFKLRSAQRLHDVGLLPSSHGWRFELAAVVAVGRTVSMHTLLAGLAGLRRGHGVGKPSYTVVEGLHNVGRRFRPDQMA